MSLFIVIHVSCHNGLSSYTNKNRKKLNKKKEETLEPVSGNVSFAFTPAKHDGSTGRWHLIDWMKVSTESTKQIRWNDFQSIFGCWKIISQSPRSVSMTQNWQLNTHQSRLIHGATWMRKYSTGTTVATVRWGGWTERVVKFIMEIRFDLRTWLMAPLNAT